MDALLKDVLGAFPETEIDTPSPKKRKAVPAEKVKDKIKDSDKESKDKEKEEEGVVKPQADEPDTGVNVKPWLWKPPDGSQSNFKGYNRPYGNQGYQNYRGGYQGGGGGYQGGGGYNGGRGSFGGNGGYNNSYSQRRFQPYGQGQGDSGFRSSYYSSNGNFPPGGGTGNDRGGFKKNF